MAPGSALQYPEACVFLHDIITYTKWRAALYPESPETEEPHNSSNYYVCSANIHHSLPSFNTNNSFSQVSRFRATHSPYSCNLKHHKRLHLRLCLTSQIHTLYPQITDLACIKLGYRQHAGTKELYFFAL